MAETGITQVTPAVIHLALCPSVPGYLDDLEPDEYGRDHDLLMNTIRGMSGTT